MKVNYLEALKLAAKKSPKPAPDAIDQIVKKVEQIRETVKSRAVAA